MTHRECNMAVKQLPQTLNVKQMRRFLSELESCMNMDRPCIVLDCSNLCEMDRSALHLLLCCLEKTMMRNGDVKLAAMPAGARTAFELTGAHTIFEIFDTNADAVNSFRRLPGDVTTNVRMLGSEPLGQEKVA